MSKFVQVLRGQLVSMIDASCRLSIETYVIQNRTDRWNKTDIYREQNKFKTILRLAKKYKNAYKEEYIGKNKEIIWKQLSVRLYTAGLDVTETYVHVSLSESWRGP